MLTLVQAAETAGISTSALRRAIREGRIPATRNGQGHYEIDASHLSLLQESPTIETADAPVEAPESEIAMLCGKLGLMCDQLETMKLEKGVYPDILDQQRMDQAV